MQIGKVESKKSMKESHQSLSARKIRKSISHNVQALLTGGSENQRRRGHKYAVNSMEKSRIVEDSDL